MRLICPLGAPDLFGSSPWNDGPEYIGILDHEGAPRIARQHLCNGGGKGAGQSSQATTSTTQIPPEVLARYNSVNANAEQAAQNPFQPYTGEMVAPVNYQQWDAVNNITNAQGTVAPYYGQANTQLGQGLASASPLFSSAGENITQGQNYGSNLNSTALNTLGGATGLAFAGMNQVNPGSLNVNQYMSPYNESVVQSTLANLQQQQQQEQQGLKSNAILSGSYGGDRTGIAQANLARQQGLATGQVASSLYNQNYQQALGAAQQQQGVGLAAGQANRAALQQGAGQIAGIAGQQAGIGQQGYAQGLGAAQAQQGLGQAAYGVGQSAAQTYAGLGTGLLQNQLAQGQAQLGAGTLVQQTQQARDQANYNQFLQQQGYPFQVSQFLANIAEGTGALSGSTTTTGGGAYQPQPFFSDERLKENIKTIGHTKDGLKIIKFNYKGSNQPQIGFSAQDVEKKKPEAVGLAHGYKTVDYDRATRATGGLASAGGSVANDNAYEGFADGGAPDDLSKILAMQQQMYGSMYPGANNPRGIGVATGPRGVQLPQPGGHQVLKGNAATMPEQRQQTPEFSQDLKAINDVAGAAKSGRDIYDAGSKAYDWLGTQMSTMSGLGAANDMLPAGVSSADPSAWADLFAGGMSAMRRGGVVRRKRAGGGGLGVLDSLYEGANDIGIPTSDDNARSLLDEQKGLGTRPPPGSVPSARSGKDGTGKAIGSIAGGLAGSAFGPLGSMAGSTIGGMLGDMFKAGGSVGNGSRAPLREILQRARHAIGQIESGNRYDVVGPETDGHRPYGIHQVMDFNIGPWTKAVTGTAMSPQEFLKNPAVQDRVFDHYFSDAMLKHGTPQDAASVWFSGQPIKQAGEAKDVLGTSVPDYVKKFNSLMGYEGQSAPDRALRLVADNTAPQGGDDDVGLTARTLNQLGLATGGRIHKDEGGSIDDDPALAELLRERKEPPLPPYEFKNGIPGVGMGEPPRTGPAMAPAAPPAAPPSAPPPAAPQGGLGTPPGAMSLNAGPPMPANADAVAAPLGGSGLGTTPAASPGFFDKKGWLDRNEQPIVTSLAFLGSMLGSPSRTLAGSVGHGLSAAAQTYPAFGFKQQGLDIQQQQANTQQLQQVMQAMNLVSRQKAGFSQSNPAASTERFDQNLTALSGRMYDLLATKDAKATPSQGAPSDYFKQLPPPAQQFISQVRPQDNPWYWQYLANNSIEPSDRTSYERQRDQATERMRLGQAISLDGTKTVPVDALTQAAMGLKTAETEAGTKGTLGYWEARLETAKSAALQFTRDHPGFTGDINSLPPAKRATYANLQKAIEDAQRAINSHVPAQRRSGGRIGRADGGDIPDGPELAQAPDAPAAEGPDYNDPGYHRKRAQVYGGLGLEGEARKSLDEAARLDEQRRSSGVKTGPAGTVEPVPGSIPTKQAQEAAVLQTAENQKLKNETLARAEEGMQAKQLAQTMRNLLFDETGKPVQTMGPLSNRLSSLGSYLEQVGFKPETVKSFMNVDPADTQAVNKLLTSMGAQIARNEINGPVRQQEFLRFIGTTPSAELLPKAAAYLIDNVLIPKADYEINAYDRIAKAPPGSDYQNVHYQYMRENPWYRGTRMPGTEAKAAAPLAIPPVDKREVGKVYTNPNGVKGRWTGSGFEKVE